MTRWFRFYDDALNDPKVQMLPEYEFKVWVNVLCLASKNDGHLPRKDDIAFALRLTMAETSNILKRLSDCGLLDNVEGLISPHNWAGRQYKSDTSNDRVQRYRQRKRNVTETVTVTPPETEQIQNTEQKDIRAVAKATRPNPDFEEFWEARPRRKGADPKDPARRIYETAVKTIPPDELLSAVKRYRAAEVENANTPFLPQMVKWLRDKRWNDYPVLSLVADVPHGMFYAKAESEQLAAWDTYGLRTAGKGMPRDKNQGWHVKSEWPPDYDPVAELSETLKRGMMP